MRWPFRLVVWTLITIRHEQLLLWVCAALRVTEHQLYSTRTVHSFLNCLSFQLRLRFFFDPLATNSRAIEHALSTGDELRAKVPRLIGVFAYSDRKFSLEHYFAFRTTRGFGRCSSGCD
jgi:hypothetical protein